ncbi:hypothetical protein [Tsukamurella pseudospumae]|nr:hypothetical protein [Tsukamurella pseudospumae]
MITTTAAVSTPPVIEVSLPLYPCECGNPDCALTVDEVEGWFSRLVPHHRVLECVADEFHLIETCAFFDDHVERCIRKFTDLAEAYPPPLAARAIVEAVNTWHGCPEELCGREA